MTNRGFEVCYKKLIVLVVNNELNEALQLLGQMIAEMPNANFEDQREEIENTYINLLNYAVHDIEDPSREKIYNQTQTQILELADNVRNNFFTKESDNLIYQLKRKGNVQPFDFIKTEDETVSAFFHKVFEKLWLTDKYDEELIGKLRIYEDFSSVEITCALVSAITLSLIRTFDEKKFHLLLSHLFSRETKVQQRAFVGLIFCVQLHTARIPLYKSLDERLKITMQENFDLSDQLRNALLQMLIANETEKITQKMKEVMPEILKNKIPNDKLEENLNKMFEQDSDENEQMGDFNPKWESLIENAAMSEKAMELSKLHSEGGDLFMGTFSKMKTFSFFNEISNWFLPFFEENLFTEYTTNIAEMRMLSNSLKKSFILCNSDKYSMLCSAPSVPQQYREMMMNTLKIDAQESEEKFEEFGRKEREQHECRMYIQDLFRFYNLYCYKNDFHNPFSSLKTLEKNLLIQYAAQRKSILDTLVDYYIKKEYYGQAIDLLESIRPQQGRKGQEGEIELTMSDIDNLQKMAFCHQQRENYEKAVHYYQQADLLQPDSSWTIERIAYCLKKMGKYEESLHYYQKYDKMNPDQTNILLNIGYCNMRMGKHEEALKTFYKIEYLQPENRQVKKAIGWCSLISHKLESALKYYGKLASKQLNASDLMNIGHTQYLLGNEASAIESYKESYNKLGRIEFVKAFKDDQTMLSSYGMTEEKTMLLLDYLLFKMK